jgi:2-polyprenyl-3-methyl-5-hydroxy-6-metoxy-1,4-benzoquinol methylase
MDDVPQIDVKEIMEQLREKIRKRQQEFFHADPANALSDGPVAADLVSLQSSYDIYHIHFTSHRKGLGRLVVLAKQVLRKLLTPILERQLAYNIANTRIAHHLCKQVAGVFQQQAATSQALQEIVVEQVEGLYQAVQAVREMVVEQVEGLGQQLEGLGQQQAAAFQTLREAVVEQVEGLGQQQTAAVGALQKALFNGLQHRVNEVRDSVAETLQAQQEKFSRTERTLADADARMVELERLGLRLKTNLSMQERRLTMFLEEARKRLPDPLNQEQLQSMAEEEKHALDALYVSFEDQFRGSREDIKERLRVYLPILKKAQLGTDEMPVLDVGCGRGEWLELLKEQNLRAQGVDVNRVLVGECQRQGLEVIERDVIVYLRTLPDASLGAVTGFHIIEHLPFEVLVKLMDETVRVLKPGGVAIFETPNPENVLVGSYTFYLDPTHRNPLPSAVVKFMAEARGLCRVEVMNLHSLEAYRMEEAGLEITKRFNEYFYGPQDYAVVGWKA